MIVKEFNNGWGFEVPLMRWQSNILAQYLDKLSTDTNKTAIIHSVWYNREYHSRVLDSLRDIQPDKIILVSMLDFSIPDATWFDLPGSEILEVGYYRGNNHIDAWALIVDEFMTRYTDAELSAEQISVPYMCLNRKPHWHRKRIFSDLTNKGLIEKGLVSMGGSGPVPEKSLVLDQGRSELAPNAGIEQHGIANDIMSLGALDNWRRHFLNIVTETIYDVDRQWFASEKIYKPIIGNRPFLVYAPNGARDWLASHGMIDYCGDFGDISDLDLSIPENIVPFVEILCQQPIGYLQSKYLALSEKIKYNKSQFHHHVRTTRQKIQQGVICLT